MTTISVVSPATGQTGSSGSPLASASQAASASVEDQFNSFIQLLTAQVQNQDPLAPMDSTQFVDQLATFSALEQQVRTNQLLEGMSGMLSALFLSQSAATLPADQDLPLQT